MNSKRARAAVAALLVLTTAGCTMTGTEIDETPTFEQVTAEGEGALDRILGLLPEGTEITVREQEAPYPCSDGAMFAQRRDAYVPEDFDVEGFMNDLPDLLHGEIVLGEQLPVEDPALMFTMPGFGDAGLSVSSYLPPDRPGFSLLVTSRCGSVGNAG